MKFEHVEGRLPIPEDTKRAVLERANGCCENCGDRFEISRKFRFHHVTYTRLIYPWTSFEEVVSVLGIEEPDELQWLCWDCHQKKHRGPGGEYYLDPEEASEQWDRYWHAWDKD